MRLRELDILRALAVLLVLGRHYAPMPRETVGEVPRWLALTWGQVGWIGVDLFFVLSGFLVGGLLFTEYQRYGRVDAKRFLVRRGFKIYPAFWLLLFVTWAMQHAAGRDSPVWWGRFFDEVLYLQNYDGGLWNHTWSLAVEEHFYFLLCWLVVRLTGSRGGSPDPFRPLVMLVPLIGMLALAARLATNLYSPYAHLTHLFPTHLRIDSLFWGVLLAYAYHFRDRAWLATVRRWWPLAVGAALVLASPAWIWTIGHSSALLPTVGLTTIAWSAVVLLALAIAPRPQRTAGAVWRQPLGALGVIGVHSYSIYLWHMPVVIWVLPMLDRHGWFAGMSPTTAFVLRYAAFLTVAIVGGIVASKLVERPMLALRDRRFPSRAVALEGAMPAAAIPSATIFVRAESSTAGT